MHPLTEAIGRGIDKTHAAMLLASQTATEAKTVEDDELALEYSNLANYLNTLADGLAGAANVSMRLAQRLQADPATVTATAPEPVAIPVWGVPELVALRKQVLALSHA